MGVTVRQKNKVRGAPYWVFINFKGKRKSICVGDKAAALKVASKIREGLKTGQVGMENEKPAPTFGQVAKDWIEVTVPATCKASTTEDYGLILRKHVLPIFKDKFVDQINRLEVKDFLLAKLSDGYSSLQSEPHEGGYLRGDESRCGGGDHPCQPRPPARQAV